MGQPRTRIINTPKGRTIIQLRGDKESLSSISMKEDKNDVYSNQKSTKDELNLLKSRKRFYSMDGLSASKGKFKLSTVKELDRSIDKENVSSSSTSANFYTDLYPNKEGRRRSTSVSLNLSSRSVGGLVSPSRLDKSLQSLNSWKNNHTRSTPSIPELEHKIKMYPVPINIEGSCEELPQQPMLKKIPPKKPPRSRTRAMSVDNIMTSELKNRRRQSISGTPTKTFDTNSRPRLSTVSSTGRLPLSIADSKALKDFPKRRPVVRAPSRLYKVLDSEEVSSVARKKNSTMPFILGPEFVVRSKEAPKLITLFTKQGSQKNLTKKVTVVIITGKRIEIKCDPSSAKVKHVLEAIMDEEQLPLPHLFGLSLLVGGEFHFLSPNTKLYKIAPSGWKDQFPTKHGFIQDNFTLHLRLIYYLRFGDLMRLESKMRRLIYLQLRHDLLEGRLPLPSSSIIQLTALTLQAEFGDYFNHEPGYFMLEHYLPEVVLCENGATQLTEELYRRHAALEGLLPFQAQARFVALLQDMLYYGAHFFKATPEKTDCSHWIGIWPGGLLVLTGPPGPDNLCRASLHPWSVVKRMSHTSSRLMFTVKSPGGTLKLRFIMTLNRSSYASYLCKVHQNFFHDQSSVVSEGISQLSCSRNVSVCGIHHLTEDSTSPNSVVNQDIVVAQTEKSYDFAKTGRASALSSDSNEYHSLSTSSDTLRSHITSNHTLSPASSKIDISSDNIQEQEFGSLTFSDKENSNKKTYSSADSSVTTGMYNESYRNRSHKLPKKSAVETGYSSDDKRSSLDNSLDSSINADEREYSESAKQRKAKQKKSSFSKLGNHSDLRQNFLQNIFWKGGSDESANSFTNKFREKIEDDKNIMASKDEVDGKLTNTDNDLLAHKRSHSNIENSTGLNDSLNSDVSRGYDSDETLLRSPKKGWFSVKMGTRVSAAALHKQRLRSLETIQPLPSLEELNTTPTAVIMEPSECSANLEESVNDSLVERFLRAGSSTTSFRCCERRLASITLTKDAQGSLGVMIGEGVDHGLYIQAVTPGGPAHKGGELQAGDRIVGINGLSVESFSYNRAVEMLRNAPPVVTLLVSQPIIIPSPAESLLCSVKSERQNISSSKLPDGIQSEVSASNTDINRCFSPKDISTTRPRSLYSPLHSPKTTEELIDSRLKSSSLSLNYISDAVKPIKLVQRVDKIPDTVKTNGFSNFTDEIPDSLYHQGKQHVQKNNKEDAKITTDVAADVRSGHVTLVTLNTTLKENT